MFELRFLLFVVILIAVFSYILIRHGKQQRNLEIEKEQIKKVRKFIKENQSVKDYVENLSDIDIDDNI